MDDRTQPLRRCYRCKVERPMEMFYVGTETRRGQALGRGPVRFPCRLCNREIAEIRMRPRRAIVDEAKLVGCADCGHTDLDHPEVFDFDHLPGYEKLVGVAARMTKGTVEELLAEIDKCEVVCANCHRIRTKGRQHVTFGRDRLNG